MPDLLPFIYRISFENAIDNKLNGMTLREQLIDWAWAALEDKAALAEKLAEYRDIQEREGHEDVVVSVQWDHEDFMVVIEEGE